ncbi:MAG: Patatin [Firmicutes bacterium]|nr:Patatin [Bacillota bacterium]
MTGIGLALGGGGSKGAFQIGVWRALREQGQQFTAITGTSIGAVNAALMLSAGYDRALEMWQNLNMEQCLTFSSDINLKSTDLLSIHNANLLAREVLAQGGLDTKPLYDLLQYYIDEAAVRRNPVRFGLMTVLIPDLKPQPMWIEQIPEGKLIDFIMASAHLPGLQPVEIDGRRYLDGGFAENVPVSMLRRIGLRRIFAVDLEARPSLRGPLEDNTQMVFIHDKKDLGGMLDLTPAVLQRNRQLGYLDALKAMDCLCGDYYTFSPAAYDQLIWQFGYDLLAGLEQAALTYDLDRCLIYNAENFISEIRRRRQETQMIYEQRRQELQVESKLRAIASGKLKVLNLLPPLKLAMLLEMKASNLQNGTTSKIPLKLFANLNAAALALQEIPDDYLID